MGDLLLLVYYPLHLLDLLFFVFLKVLFGRVPQETHVEFFLLILLASEQVLLLLHFLESFFCEPSLFLSASLESENTFLSVSTL